MSDNLQRVNQFNELKTIDPVRQEILDGCCYYAGNLFTSVSDGATVTANGTEISNAPITVASTGLPIATSAASAEEDTFWLLKPNTNYLIQVWNRSGGDAADIYIDLRARDEVNYVEI